MDKKKANIVTLLVFLMLTLFPLAFDDHYFNITPVKYRIFAFLALGIFYSGIYLTLCQNIETHSGLKLKLPLRFYRNLSGGDVCMITLLMISSVSCLASEWKLAAFSGSAGTMTGLVFLLMAGGMYYGVSRHLVVKPFILYSFPVILFILTIMSTIQYCGYDIMEFLKDIDPLWTEYYIATLGHINVFASLVSVYLSVCLYMFCCSKGKSVFLYGIGVFSGFISLLASNSDSCYLGTGAAMIILFTISIRKASMTLRYGVSLLLASASLAFWHLLGQIFYETFRTPSKLNLIAVSPPIIIGSLLSGIVLLLAGYYGKRNSKQFSPIPSRIFIGLFSILFVLLIAVIIWFSAFDKETSLGGFENYLRFNKNWGNSRGYPWTWVIEFFISAPLFVKLLGTGPDTAGLIFVRYHNGEIKGDLDFYFISAHNVYLDYLLTIGLLGLAAYIGLLVTSICSCVRKSRDSDFYGAVGLAIASYTVISVVTISQPITVPFIFLLAALANNKDL